jgi:hypothetical protein
MDGLLSDAQRRRRRERGRVMKKKCCICDKKKVTKVVYIGAVFAPMCKPCFTSWKKGDASKWGQR